MCVPYFNQSFVCFVSDFRSWNTYGASNGVVSLSKYYFVKNKKWKISRIIVVVYVLVKSYGCYIKLWMS